ncbi:hypothetical protein ABB37_03487 [Leptomonas pyrrhocoris]|uniref:Protein artemis n=1 Tax=Leptomonas pyrrhocoris TaxID=157538 RepID=A0A0M9G518_LEPPY|nr:hypothetical protein ABB37_03487 [Leptomonas pyrrhocoris]XP_015660853.1 hypothetical protein ABB37_03487 [Leptomonas pyrrhocoris]KPA82413.1 hypothetical protein ABB37_03487 [Leptomonas pyrrhocoris]KPA82414.1 hypothetical protein ABB37_03487 [Leptomonas pyrrhocoris]|eukprot:XP_015660852.1 hypothetical protein ABB37_03487 [Leptomonas pyrrhocoris]
MAFFSRDTPSSPGGEGGARRTAPADYFKSREVYRSERGLILVDAFRFVEHSYISCSVSYQSPRAEAHVVKLESAADQRQRAPRKFFFLSHFHSDHYTGIRRTWHTDTIYCSRATAALTQSELGVSSACLFPMDMHETYVFSLQTGVCLACVPETPLHPRVQAMLRGAPSPPSTPTTTTRIGHVEQEDVFAVRLIPANHCPGAAIFFFVSPLFGTVVHTGDFRFNGSQRRWREAVCAPGHRTYVSIPQLQQQARVSTSSVIADVPPLPPYEQFIEDDVALREVAEKEALDVLFLDNTFCGPPYKFPTQWESTQTVVCVLHSLLNRAARRQKDAADAASSSPSPPRTCVRCAVLVGCYTIGKERVALAIRDAFPRALSQPSASDGDKEDAKQRNWRIYVSPRRYAMLAATNFFPSCFEALRSSAAATPKKEGAALGDPNDALTDNSNSAGVPFAVVEDTPVQLPVLLQSQTAQRMWAEAQATGTGRTNDVESDEMPHSLTRVAAPTPEMRRSLAADSRTEVSDTPDSPLSSKPRGDDDTQYLLSVFLVSMANVGYQSVAALAQKGRDATVLLEDNLRLDLSPYDCVLLVEPTGWCKRDSTREINHKLTLLKVPYSEHCGFQEMVRFVQFVNPRRVVPTVSEDAFKAHEVFFVEKAPRLRSRVSNVQPITRFLASAPIPNSTERVEVEKETAKHNVGERSRSGTAAYVSNGSHVSTTTTTATTAAVTNVRTNPRERRASVRHMTAATSVSSSTVVPSGQLSAPSVGESEDELYPSLTGSKQEEPYRNATNFRRSANEERKRSQPAEGDTSTAAAETSSAAQTLDRLFQRVKVDAVRRGSQAASRLTGKTGPPHCSNDQNSSEDDEDCQLVQIVQTVVEISDDD